MASNLKVSNSNSNPNSTFNSNIRNINLTGKGADAVEETSNATNNENSNTNSNSNNENARTENANASNENTPSSTNESMENASAANESFIPLEPVAGNMNGNANANKPANKINRLSNLTMKNKANSNSNVPKMTVDALAKVCEDMLTHHIAMKMFHFQTDSYAAHKASDTYITEFLAFHDLFMETAQGIYGKLSADKHNCTTALFSSTSDCIKHVDEYRMKMKELRTRVSDQPDLVNMIDEQIHRMNQLKYLLTFK